MSCLAWCQVGGGGDTGQFPEGDGLRKGLGSRWWLGNRGNGSLARGLAAGLAAVSLSLLGTVPALGITATPAGDLAVPLQDGGGHAARTVVTLTFDDGDADQMAAAQVLHRYRLPATFYIITGAVGAPGYVTRSDLRQLAADGNEIGGHTVSHLRLTALSTGEARRQVCDSRSILARWGYRAVSFAYPGGADSPRTEAIVRGCGYTSARGVVGLRAPGCPGCARTEGIPPPNPMALRTAGEVDSSWSLDDLERTVIAAERQGGWLPLVFHHVCGGSHCGGLAVRATMLETFARWLASRQRLGTAVQTVGQVMGRSGRRAPSGLPRTSRRPRRTGWSTRRWSRTPRRARWAPHWKPRPLRPPIRPGAGWRVATGATPPAGSAPRTATRGTGLSS